MDKPSGPGRPAEHTAPHADRMLSEITVQMPPTIAVNPTTRIADAADALMTEAA